MFCLQNRTRMARILRICADFVAFALGSLIYPRVSAQSASSAFYDLAFSDTLLEDLQIAIGDICGDFRPSFILLLAAYIVYNPLAKVKNLFVRFFIVQEIINSSG